MQWCYSAILHVELHCSIIAKKFAIVGFYNSRCWGFWTWNAIFSLHLAFAILSVNALREIFIARGFSIPPFCPVVPKLELFGIPFPLLSTLAYSIAQISWTDFELIVPHTRHLFLTSFEVLFSHLECLIYGSGETWWFLGTIPP